MPFLLLTLEVGSLGVKINNVLSQGCRAQVVKQLEQKLNFLFQGGKSLVQNHRPPGLVVEGTDMARIIHWELIASNLGFCEVDC